VLSLSCKLPTLAIPIVGIEPIGPKDTQTRTISVISPDHLVGTGQDRGRNRQVDRLRGVEVHRQIEFAGRFDRYSAGLRALEDPVNETRGAAEQVAVIGGERPRLAVCCSGTFGATVDCLPVCVRW